MSTSTKVRARLRALDSDFREVLLGGFAAIAVKIAAGISLYGMTIILSRQLGPEEAGIFFIVFALTTILAAIVRLGLDNTFVRFIAAARAQSRWGPVIYLYRTGLVCSFAASALLSVVIFYAAAPLARGVFGIPALSDTLRVMALTLPLSSYYVLTARGLQGLKRITLSIALLTLSVPFSASLSFLVATPADALEAARLFLVAHIIAACAAYFLWPSPPTSCVVPTRIPTSELLASALPLLIVFGMTQVAMWAPSLLLGVWHAPESVAVFNAAQRTSLLVAFVLGAVNSIIAPKFAELHQRKDVPGLRRTAIRWARLLSLLAVPVVAAMVLAPDLWMSIFGPDFRVGANALSVLAVAQFVNVSTGSVALLLAMTGNEKLLQINAIASALATVSLSVALIPSFGLTGAAVASAVGVATLNLLAVVQVKRVFKFNMLALWTR
jgi:O-antigen/teichoic acid export membrane protein